MSALSFETLSTELTQALTAQPDTPSKTTARCTLGRDKVMVLVEYPLDSAKAESHAAQTLDWLETHLRDRFDTRGLPEEVADLSDIAEAVSIQLYLKHRSEAKPFTMRSFTWKVDDGFDDLFGVSEGMAEDDSEALPDGQLEDLPLTPSISVEEPELIEGSEALTFQELDNHQGSEDDTLEISSATTDDLSYEFGLYDTLPSAAAAKRTTASTDSAITVNEVAAEDEALFPELLPEGEDDLILSELEEDPLELDLESDIESDIESEAELDFESALSVGIPAQQSTTSFSAESSEFTLPGEEPTIASSDLDLPTVELPVTVTSRPDTASSDFFDLHTADDSNGLKDASESPTSSELDFSAAFSQSETSEMVLPTQGDAEVDLFDISAEPTTPVEPEVATEVMPTVASPDLFSTVSTPFTPEETALEEDLFEPTVLTEEPLALAEDNLVEEALATDEPIADEFIGDGMSANEVIADEQVEDSLLEDQLLEDESLEDSLLEDQLPEEELPEDTTDLIDHNQRQAESNLVSAVDESDSMFESELENAESEGAELEAALDIEDLMDEPQSDLSGDLSDESSSDRYRLDEITSDDLNTDDLGADDLNTDDLGADDLSADDLGANEPNSDELNSDELVLEAPGLEDYDMEARELSPTADEQEHFSVIEEALSEEALSEEALSEEADTDTEPPRKQLSEEALIDALDMSALAAGYGLSLHDSSHNDIEDDDTGGDDIGVYDAGVGGYAYQPEGEITLDLPDAANYSQQGEAFEGGAEDYGAENYGTEDYAETSYSGALPSGSLSSELPYSEQDSGHQSDYQSGYEADLANAALGLADPTEKEDYDYDGESYSREEYENDPAYYLEGEEDTEEEFEYENIAQIDEGEVQRQREQWQQQSKGNPFIFVAAAGFVAVGLVGYVVTRPCLVGGCDRIQTAQQTGDEALASLGRNSSLDEVKESQQQLRRSIQLLTPIPVWSPHHSEAQAILPEYERQIVSLDWVTDAQSQAYGAAVKSQNPPHALSTWEEIADEWRESIASLESVPTDSPVRSLAEAKLVEYRANLSTILVRIETESSAEVSLRRAQQSASQATAIVDTATTLEDWETALESWKTAVDSLKGIPQGTKAYAEAQQILPEYEADYLEVREQAEKERSADRSLSTAKELAADAQRAKSEGAWTVSVEKWKSAVNQLTNVPQASLAYSEVETLTSLYTSELAEAEASQLVSLRFQPIEPSFYLVCGETVTQKCTYSVQGSSVRVDLFQGYDAVIDQSITPPNQRAGGLTDDVLISQSNQLLQQITLLSTQAQIPVELYSAEGNFMALYRPDLDGFTRNRDTLE